MGITGLLGLLGSIQKPCNLKHFQGQTLGVDTYGWLHRGAIGNAIELALDKPTRKHVDFALHRVRMLLHFGVKPYLVFDGDNLPSKAKTEQDREERRKESKRTGLELLRLRKTGQAYQELQKAVDVTPKMARQLIDELKKMGVEYVVAPYEADAQLAYLEKAGFIDGIISEDSDLLVFGSKLLLTKLDQYGGCVMIRQNDFTACREVNLVGWTNADFRMMAIMSGCDYLEGIHRMGLKTAHRLVRKYKSIDKIIRGAQLEHKFRIPTDYLDKFMQAEMTFRYQWVFCPKAERLINLTTPENEGQLDGLSCIGEYVEEEVAQKVASGELDPTTKLPILVESQPTLNTFTPMQARTLDRENQKPVELEKNMSIDKFFKPKRTPLAELDPNSFTPSPSQQRLTQQANFSSWSADRVRNISTGQREQSESLTRSSPFGRIITPAPRPSKRRRLCEEILDESSLNQNQVERSKFFSSPVPPSAVPFKGNRARKSRDKDITIWSDDSIEEAMAEIPDAKPSPNDIVGNSSISNSSTSTANPAANESIPDTHDYSIPDHLGNKEKEESISSSWLRAQIQALGDRSASSRVEDLSIEASRSEPQTPTPKPVKGSEDTLLVPNSVDSKRSADSCEDEAETKVFDIRRFAFSAIPP